MTAQKIHSKAGKGGRAARGFMQTGGILQQHIRTASEKRGFVETRLLTHWREIVGDALADVSRPVKVSYGQQGIGATLTILTNGANAPLLQADLPRIKDKVNACYGYAAISRIRITQTAETGFSEAPASFDHKPRPAPDPQKVAEVEKVVGDVGDDNLRSALAALGRNILTHKQN